MRKLISLSLCVLGLAMAKPVIGPYGIASLYLKTENGNLLAMCTGAKIEDPVLETKLKYKDALLTAAHCRSTKLPTKGPSFVYASFDDGDVMLRIKPLILGEQMDGYDVALWIPYDERSRSIYDTVKPYSLAKDKIFDYGDDIFNWGHPLGLSLTYAKGFVANPKIDRPIVEGSINWIDTLAVYLDCTGGCSGSPIFDQNGKIAAIVSGRILDFTGYGMTFANPISRLYELLDDENLTIPLDKKRKDESKKDDE